MHFAILEGKDDVERFQLFGNTKYGNDQPEMSDYYFSLLWRDLLNLNR